MTTAPLTHPIAFYKAMGLETEHALTFHPAMPLSNAEYVQERIRIAKEFVAGCPAFEGAKWSYRYPYELYRFPNTVNRLLKNGSRLYDENGYVELSTAECLSPYDLIGVERATTQILEEALTAFRERSGIDSLSLLKTNVEYGSALPWSASNACHENYAVSPSLFSKLIDPACYDTRRHWIPFLVTRTVFTGAGCVLARAPRELLEREVEASLDAVEARALLERFPPEGVSFQISQRADFLTRMGHIETTRLRPLLNTRDEPHANPAQTKRLHVIAGDANRCDLSIFLKTGVTQLFLSMLETGFLTDAFELAEPLAALRTVSRDLSLRQPLAMAFGGSATALEIQGAFLAQAERFCALYLGDIPPHYEEVLAEWRRVLENLSQNPALMAYELDWTAKRGLIQEMTSSRGVSDTSPEACAIDIKFSTVGDLLYAQFDRHLARRMVSQKRTERFLNSPPNTRAARRCAFLMQGEAKEVNWDFVALNSGETQFLNDPLAL